MLSNSSLQTKKQEVITITRKTPWRRRLISLFCVILIFSGIMTAAYADDTITCGSRFTTNYYYQGITGLWVELDTQQHFVNETGYVAYCLQMEKDSPRNSTYSKVNALDCYDQTTVNGLLAILENGYPNSNGGFPDDQARYATANAIRFWIAERGGDGMMGWLNYSKNKDLFTYKPGYEKLFHWTVSLLELAENQTIIEKTVAFSNRSLTLSEEDSIFVGTVSVTTNCNGGYELNTDALPAGATVSGYTGKSGDTLRICVPLENESTSFNLSAVGKDNRTPASLIFYKPDRTNEQRLLGYAFDIYGEAASDSMTVSVPKATPKTAALSILKVDADTGKPIPGVSFAIYDGGKFKLCTRKTNDSGIITMTGLSLGTYYYKEVSAPEGYIVDDMMYKIILSEGGKTVSVTCTNKKQTKAALEIVKLDAETAKPLSGAGFRLFDADGKQIAQGYTDPNGRLAFSELPIGEYSYQEFYAPAGYILDDTVYPVSLTVGGKTVTVTRENHRRVGTIQVTKLDADSGPLSGAAFLLEFSADEGDTWSPVTYRETDAVTVGGCTSPGLSAGQLVSGEDGIVSFTGLYADDSVLYRLTETHAPEGHDLLGTIFCGSLPVQVTDINAADSEIRNGRTYCYTLYVTAIDCATFRLPQTGGSGFLFIPISMLFGAATILNSKRRSSK